MREHEDEKEKVQGWEREWKKVSGSDREIERDRARDTYTEKGGIEDDCKKYLNR